MAEKSSATITRDQFKRLTKKLLKEAPTILKQRDTSDKSMDKKSALLQALYTRLQEKLGIPHKEEGVTKRGFKTYEFTFREAIYDLALEHSAQSFDYQKIVNDFLDRAETLAHRLSRAFHFWQL
jgi:hypothetical protein